MDDNESAVIAAAESIVRGAAEGSVEQLLDMLDVRLALALHRLSQASEAALTAMEELYQVATEYTPLQAEAARLLAGCPAGESGEDGALLDDAHADGSVMLRGHPYAVHRPFDMLTLTAMGILKVHGALPDR